MPRLLIESAIGRAELFALNVPRTAIGRGPGNRVILEDPRVSRFHAVIDVEANLFVVRDLFSSNGIYVNGRKVHARALQSGDTVTIGDCQARFIADEDFYEIVAEARPTLPGHRADLVDTMAGGLLTS